MATFFSCHNYGNFFCQKKSCHFEKLPFWGLKNFFLAIIMASYFGMPNYGNFFVKTKWQEKCPLKSFKTVSEHYKCPVVDEQLPVDTKLLKI